MYSIYSIYNADTGFNLNANVIYFKFYPEIRTGEKVFFNHFTTKKTMIASSMKTYIFHWSKRSYALLDIFGFTDN